MSNPYDILGVSIDAEQSDIRRSYLDGAQQHHPDKEGGNSEKFIEIKRAYECLIDPAKRKLFDDLGVAPNTPEFDLLNEAINSLCNLFSQMLGQLSPEVIVSMDLINEYRKILKTSATNSKEAIRRAKESKKNILEVQKIMKKRMKKKTKKLPNIFERVLAQKLLEADGVVRSQEHAIEVVMKALELLDDYEFDFERIQQLMYGYAGMSNFTQF